MKRTRYAIIGVGLCALLALAGCSGTASESPAGDDTASVGTVDGTGKTLTVWAMQGDYAPETLEAINKKFTEETGAKVNIQTQQWPDIVTKLTTALASSNPPDVVDSGNTQIATFGATGALLNLDKYKEDLQQGQEWLPGLEEPATVDGNLIGVPSFAAGRALIYNKKIWSKAGVTSVPETYDELLADLDKIKAANTAPDFSAVYMPGQNMYANLQWLWDAGGEIATQSDGTWKGELSSKKSLTGLTEWKKFQNTYSSVASRTLGTKDPAVAQVFADGKASAIIDNPASQIPAILKANPDLTSEDIGSFAMPGKAGTTQTVLLAGECWGIAQKSANHDLALAWVKIAVSPEIERKYLFGQQMWIPNSTQLVKEALDGDSIEENRRSAFIAAQRSKATPASGNWAPMELPTGLPEFFKTIASGNMTVAKAASTWDAMLDKTLNG